MHRVTSRQNPRLIEAARLISSSRDRRKSGRCVLEGEHLVGVYIDHHGLPEALIVTEESLSRAPARRIAEAAGGRALIVSSALFAELATLPVGVGMICVVPTPNLAPQAPVDYCVLLEDIQDPGNLGSILRTAAAAGVGQAWLSKHCAFAWSPKVLRAGQGAHFLIDIFEDTDLPRWAARYDGAVIAAVATGGTGLYATDLTGRIAFALGNEGAGLSAPLLAVATQKVTIPMPGGMESLNAAAAAAVFLFEALRQRAVSLLQDG